LPATAGYDTIHARLLGGMENFNASLEAFNAPVNSLVWGWPTVGLIAVTGIFLMVGLRFMPLQRLVYGVRMVLLPSKDGSEGEITPFQALMTSLSATIGTGNIAGVAGAIAVGGPGAVFWMWIIAIFGIATKYAEAVLAVKFRETDGSGNHVGGPMYYIRNGLGSQWSCWPASALEMVFRPSKCRQHSRPLGFQG
jgi:AGCS family alanine or glycine:cation symporter